MTIYSQRDSKWATIKLGNGTGTIGQYGCTLTCIAMMMGVTPTEANEKMKSVDGFAGATKNLILWSAIDKAFPGSKFIWRGATYDNDKVKDAISKYGSCLVEVDFDGTPRTDDRHWVLFIGNGRMYDPWTGRENATSKYSILKGYAVIEPVQSTGENTPGKIELEKEKFEELVTKSTWYDEHFQDYAILQDKKTEFDQFKQTISQRLEVLAKNLYSTIDWDAVVNASAKFSQLDSKNQKLQDKLDREIQDSKKRVIEYEEKLQSLKTEMNRMKEDYDKQLSTVTARVDKEIEDLRKEKERYEFTNQVVTWFNKIFGKGKS